MHLQNAMKTEHISYRRKPSTRYDRMGQLAGKSSQSFLLAPGTDLDVSLGKSLQIQDCLGQTMAAIYHAFIVN